MLGLHFMAGINIRDSLTMTSTTCLVLVRWYRNSSYRQPRVKCLACMLQLSGGSKDSDSKHFIGMLLWKSLWWFSLDENQSTARNSEHSVLICWNTMAANFRIGMFAIQLSSIKSWWYSTWLVSVGGRWIACPPSVPVRLTTKSWSTMSSVSEVTATHSRKTSLFFRCICIMYHISLICEKWRVGSWWFVIFFLTLSGDAKCLLASILYWSVHKELFSSTCISFCSMFYRRTGQDIIQGADGCFSLLENCIFFGRRLGEVQLHHNTSLASGIGFALSFGVLYYLVGF